MQTMILEIPDNKIEIMLNIVKNLKDGVISNFEIKDKNLEIDPFFYERKKHIIQTIEDIDSGKIKMYDFDESMDDLIEELKS